MLISHESSPLKLLHSVQFDDIVSVSPVGTGSTTSIGREGGVGDGTRCVQDEVRPAQPGAELHPEGRRKQDRRHRCSRHGQQVRATNVNKKAFQSKDQPCVCQ